MAQLYLLGAAGQLVQGVAQPWTAHRVVNMRGSLMEQVKVLWRDRGNVTLETLGKEQGLAPARLRSIIVV
jgi:hypothetical protein